MFPSVWIMVFMESTFKNNMRICALQVVWNENILKWILGLEENAD